MSKLGSLLKQVSTIALLFALMTLILFAIRLTKIQAAQTGSQTISLEPFYTNPAHQSDVLLEDFIVDKQEYENSCGPATISMVYSYLVKPISERELANKTKIVLGESGMLPFQFFSTLQLALRDSGYRVEHQVNVTDIAFLEGVYAQLKQGIPVPIYFSTLNDWDRPNFDTHYSVIIGLRPHTREVVIANAYGYMETMAVLDLLDAVKFDNYQDAPLEFWLGLFVGAINKSNLYLIQK